MSRSNKLLSLIWPKTELIVKFLPSCQNKQESQISPPHLKRVNSLTQPKGL